MTGRLRAALRIAHSTLHVLHGVGIAVGFDRLTPARRHARVRWWAGETLRRMGVAVEAAGVPAGAGTLIVANHVSWLDILALHAVCPEARFVSKAAVRRWPLLSKLVAAGGTLYLERERKRDALRVVHEMAAALGAGEVVAIFPEGTTSDGRALLPFHANLLEAAITTGAKVQPVALRFSDATSRCSAAVEFVGETTLATSLWRVARGQGLTVHLALLPPREAAGMDRRALARLLRDDIAEALGLSASPSRSPSTEPSAHAVR